jgi:hypothetical protein
MILQVAGLVFVGQLGDLVRTIDGPQILLIVLAILAVLDLGVFVAPVARFQRAPLTLG